MIRTTLLLLLCAISTQAATSLIDLDYRKLISRADLIYTNPVARSEEGVPIGNGHMGSLVWTTPSALKFQINRSDVFAVDSTTTSFPQADSDYGSGCGYVDINLVDAGEDVFVDDTFHQQLSLYDGLLTVQGRDVVARLVAWPQLDVMAIEIDDKRAQPSAINVDLRMLRYQIQYFPKQNYALATNHAVMFKKGEHTATSKLDIVNGKILLTQECREHDFYDASAVAISTVGRPARARCLNESTVQLSLAPAKGLCTVLISSAATFDPTRNVGALALSELAAADALGFDKLQASAASWWHDFWSKGSGTWVVAKILLVCSQLEMPRRFANGSPAVTPTRGAFAFRPLKNGSSPPTERNANSPGETNGVLIYPAFRPQNRTNALQQNP